ncbi:hypothetical protein AB0B40_05650 [Streptomyces sp. NPDC042638]
MAEVLGERLDALARIQEHGANAARHPLSATARSLTDLGRQLT